MRGCVILNPAAGSADEAGSLREAIKRLGDMSVKETSEADDATHFATQAIEDGCELVVAAGGDGTINEVVNGLSNNWSQAKLAILPLGTGNDFARTIGAPTDINAAIESILRDDCRRIDVVCAESDKTRYFVNVSSGGFSGLVDENLTDEMKSAWGPLSYLRAAAASLPDLANYHMTIQFDDEEPQNIVAYNLVVANARYVAGGIPIAPDAVLDDGKFDVVVVPAASMPRLALIVPAIWLGRHLDNPEVIFRQASKLRVDSRPGMWFNTDGELVGNEPITFTVLPGVLRVIVGPDIDSTVFRP